MVKRSKGRIASQLLGKIASIQTIQLLYTLLLVASFIIGYLFARVQAIEQGVTNAQTAATNPSAQQPLGQDPQQAAPQITDGDIKAWAKDIGLDSNKFTQCYDSQKYQENIDKDAADGSEVGVNATPSFLINGKLIVGALPFSEFKKEIDAALEGEKAADAKDVAVGNFPPEGDENAPVTIVEFSDLECPFCKRFWTDSFPQIKKEYLDTRKAKMYFRHYPLAFHPMAKPYAHAVECANEQDKFWEMHDKIFESQV